MCGARKESAAIRRRRESDEGVVQSRSSEKERKCDLEKGAVQMEKPPLHELFERAQGDRRPHSHGRCGERSDGHMQVQHRNAVDCRATMRNEQYEVTDLGRRHAGAVPSACWIGHQGA